MHRFFADASGVQNGLVSLEAGDARHAAQVLRLRPGDGIIVLCGERACEAVIESAREGVTARVTRELPATEPRTRITLYQGIPKGDKMDYVVQKCTEAGVSRIVPVEMSRCVSRVSGKDAARKTERWQRIAREAAKQSFRTALPAVEPPLAFAQLAGRLRRHALALIPWEEGGAPLRAVFAAQPDVALVIGPEGGLDAQAEIAPLRAAGGVAVTLGPRIFRTETAGLAAALSLLTLAGDLE